MAAGWARLRLAWLVAMCAVVASAAGPATAVIDSALATPPPLRPLVRTAFDGKMATISARASRCGPVLLSLRRVVRLQRLRLSRQQQQITELSRLVRDLLPGQTDVTTGGGISHGVRSEPAEAHVAGAGRQGASAAIIDLHEKAARGSLVKNMLAEFRATNKPVKPLKNLRANRMDSSKRTSSDEVKKAVGEVLSFMDAPPLNSDPCARHTGTRSLIIRCDKTKSRIMGMMIRGGCKPGAVAPDGLFEGPAWNSTLSLKIGLCVAQGVVDAIPRLHGLQTLHLLEMPAIERLPDAISALGKLKRLRVEGTSIAKLPAKFANLERLVSLGLERNNIARLPSSIGRMTQLRKLDLRRNMLENVPASFSKLVNLEEIFLASNFLKQLPRGMGGMPRVRVMLLEENQLTRLPEELPPNVEQIRAFRNALVELPPSILTMVGLERLDVSRNQLTHLPEGSWDRLTRLREVNLSHNNIKFLPFDFGNATSIQMLNLKNNRLERLPDLSLLSLKKGLLASFNRIEELPPNFGTWGIRMNVELDHNMLKTLPHSISSLNMVVSITASHNRLESLPDSIWEMPILGSLNVEHNHLMGISDAVENATNLRNLWMSYNKIGTLPQKGFRLNHNLRLLHLGHNKITSIPSEGSFFSTSSSRESSMATIDFSHNLIGPSVPEVFVKDVLADKLDLSHNQIRTLPNVFWRLLSTRVVEYHDDSIRTGLARIGALFLDHNMMDGVLGDGDVQRLGVDRVVRATDTSCQIVLDRSVFISASAATAAAAAWTDKDQTAIRWEKQGSSGESADVGEECLYLQATALSEIATVLVRECTCVSGFYRSHGDNRCVACPRYATCRNEAIVCGEGYFGRWSDTGRAVCQVCPAGSLCVRNTITPQPGQWWDTRFALSDANNNTSTAGALVNGTVVPVKSLPQYQQLSSAFRADQGVFNCQHPHACEGGVEAGCTAGYEGHLCSVCSVGYYSVGHGVCESCPPFIATALLASVGAVTITTVAVVVFWQASVHMDKIVQKGNGYVADRSTLISSESLTSVKVLVSFLQVLMSLDVSFDVPWPSQLQLFDEMFGWVNMDWLKSSSLECLWEGMAGSNSMEGAVEDISFSYYTTMAISSATPLLASAVLFLVWIGLTLAQRLVGRPGAENADMRQMLANGRLRCMQSHLLVWMFAYMPVSAKSLGYFRCDTFNGGETYWLHYDLSIRCYVPEYYDFMPVVLASIVVYTVCFPLSVLINHFACVRWMEHGAERTDRGRGPISSLVHTALVAPVVRGFQALSRPYKPKYGYWEAVEMARKVLVGAAAIHFGATPTFQLTVALAISFVCAVLHFQCAPFKSPTANKVAGINLCLLYFTMTIGVLRRLDVGTSQRTVFTWFVLGGDGVFTMVLLALIMQDVVRSLGASLVSSLKKAGKWLLRRCGSPKPSSF